MPFEKSHKSDLEISSVHCAYRKNMCFLFYFFLIHIVFAIFIVINFKIIIKNLKKKCKTFVIEFNVYL